MIKALTPDGEIATHATILYIDRSSDQQQEVVPIEDAVATAKRIRDFVGQIYQVNYFALEPPQSKTRTKISAREMETVVRALDKMTTESPKADEEDRRIAHRILAEWDSKLIIESHNETLAREADAEENC